MTNQQTVTIQNSRGLHARAAAKFVNIAGQFDAEVSVQKSGQTVSGLSIMGLMTLAAGLGSEIEIKATGPEAAEALSTLVQLIEDKFEEN